MKIKMTNEYGAQVVTCLLHLVAVREVTLLGVVSEEVTETGTCQRCATQQALADVPAKLRAALLDPRCSHTRFRQWCGQGSVYVYHRDPSSPSGVLLAASGSEQEFNAVYEQLRRDGLIGSAKAPLSPTEGLCAPSRGAW